ncbi:uncharacterized protein CLUP02_08673 [Colletotrichum lupini]|uniref:Uncharacterized protein n=1 Tax=Colletotrichum lupini TaxID=145971 RepID=A0A9Q8STA9_9PEZI|nr:uncharacterized protein CLUP02_08673 [Colletotrichum lupini]UQC83179.1 hypothetical protein CLUP02_08673 [Colletotrichum lupini]
MGPPLPAFQWDGPGECESPGTGCPIHTIPLTTHGAKRNDDGTMGHSAAQLCFNDKGMYSITIDQLPPEIASPTTASHLELWVISRRMRGPAAWIPRRHRICLWLECPARHARAQIARLLTLCLSTLKGQFCSAASSFLDPKGHCVYIATVTEFSVKPQPVKLLLSSVRPSSIIPPERTFFSHDTTAVSVQTRKYAGTDLQTFIGAECRRFVSSHPRFPSLPTRLSFCLNLLHSPSPFPAPARHKKIAFSIVRLRFIDPRQYSILSCSLGSRPQNAKTEEKLGAKTKAACVDVTRKRHHFLVIIKRQIVASQYHPKMFSTIEISRASCPPDIILDLCFEGPITPN